MDEFKDIEHKFKDIDSRVVKVFMDHYGEHDIEPLCGFDLFEDLWFGGHLKIAGLDCDFVEDEFFKLTEIVRQL